MDLLRIIGRLSLVTLLVAPAALAQTGDWQAVRDLSEGMPISVKMQGSLTHTPCSFRDATDERLTCDYNQHTWATPPKVTFEREKIRSVRLEHTDRHNLAIGMGIGMVTGAGLGAAAGVPGRTPQAVLAFATIGGVVGGFFGLEFPLFHGHVIYRQPSTKHKGNGHDPRAAEDASVARR